MKNLEFRRQYFLSTVSIDKIDSWKYLKIPTKNDNLNLYYHPDLEITHVQLKDTSLVLIGYILDPLNPNISNAEILTNLLGINSLEELFIEVENLNGRYVIIYTNAVNTFIFHDPSGMREIYYSFLNDEIYCGSTPDIINRYINFEMDDDKSIIEFFNSSEFKTSGFWVGTRTPYKNIFHLLPNFYLDLIKKMSYRYWPNKHRKEIEIKKGAEIVARILKGSILSASNRYKLHQALTAGFDTRMLLAASKDVKDKTTFLINRLGHANINSDIAISRKIANKFNLKLDIVDLNKDIDENFKSIFLKNHIFAREIHLPVFYDAYNKKLDDTYWVTGTSSNQILRLFFPLKKKAISGFDIARRFNYEKYSYAIDSIEDWLKEAKEVYEKYGYNLMNMFYWEQYTGNCQSLGATEGDIVREEFRPINCRKLISTYLSFKDKYRYKDYPMGHIMVIKILQKELLKIPIGVYYSSSYLSKRILRFFGIELFIDNLYNLCKSKIYYSSLNPNYRKNPKN